MIEKPTPEQLRPHPGERKESEPKFKDLMIVTSTLFKDASEPVTKARMEIALKFFQKARDLQIRCAVLDSGSDPGFIVELKKFDNVEVKIDAQIGMGPSRREALQMALKHEEIPFFLHTDPEKDDLINEQSLERMIAQLRGNQADIVVANRIGLIDKDSKVSRSMTKLQRWFEIRANKRANKILFGDTEGSQVDIWFGAKMFNRDGAKYFADYKSRLDKWDSMVKPIFDAHRDNKRVAAVDVDYSYDESQRKSEENSREISQKRLDQYKLILAALEDPYWKDK